ncbi:TSUP family transporter [Halomarina salina]|uniref:Probable membrane transporter protein n=1 Tax=Halomarina salina TaxID=1872699 RepID=A0ABD5RQQ8_9EURY|nr:TSUP family transporter [Halomarina salina]
MGTEQPSAGVVDFLDNLRTLRYREVTMSVATLAVLVGAVVLYPGSENVASGLGGSVGPTTVAVVVAVAIGAGLVKGVAGFGYALIATPIVASLITNDVTAVVVLAIPPWMINVFQIGETNTGLEYVRREWALIALAVVGAVVGVFFLAEFQKGPLIPFLIALLLLGYVLFQVATRFVTVDEAHNPVALGTVGALEGFLLAATNLGPLLPAYLHTFERDRERYVGGLSMVFTFVFSARIVQMAWVGLLTPYRLWLGCAIAVVTIVGLLAGTALRRRGVDERRFDLVVTALLAVIAVNILRKTTGPALRTVGDLLAAL